MALGYAPGNQVTAPIDVPPAPASANRPQHTLLALVRAVKNLRDELDLQCLAFLAGELGMLQNTPFCFSLALSQDRAVPESLILRDTFDTMLRQHTLGWDCGQLRALVDGEAAPDDLLPSSASAWLGWRRCSPLSARLLRGLSYSRMSRAAVWRDRRRGAASGILSRTKGEVCRRPLLAGLSWSAVHEPKHRWPILISAVFPHGET